MPSVLQDNGDAYGLSFNRSITIRSETDFYLSQTYDGVPVEPTNPFNGTVNSIFDLENIAAVDLYRGSLQANQGLGFSNGAGAVDALILGPRARSGGTATQNFGSDDMYHSFLYYAAIRVSCHGVQLSSFQRPARTQINGREPVLLRDKTLRLVYRRRLITSSMSIFIIFIITSGRTITSTETGTKIAKPEARP